MSSFHLGLDVAKAKLDCALRLPTGKLRHKVLSNNAAGFGALCKFLAEHKAQEVHVCMEATGTYWEAVAEFLADRGYQGQRRQSGADQGVRPVAAHAHQDGQGGCRPDRAFLRAAHAPRLASQAPSPAQRALRALVLRLDHL